MPLVGSGQISLGAIATEFGGDAQIGRAHV